VHSFAVIDNQPGSSTIATWIVRRMAPLAVQNINAVVVDKLSDPHAMRKVRLLTRDRAVLPTACSTPEGLPIDGDPLTFADIAALISETEQHQKLILAAVEAHAWRPSPKTGRVPSARRSIVPPNFPESPVIEVFRASEDTSVGRALAAANLLCRAWSVWLQTDDERCRRTVTAGGKPSMMPDGLNDPDIRVLPAQFAARMRLQPCV